jgi:D-apionate oxidoisomerase
VLTETVLGTCLTVVREALDEAIRRGVPGQAARDFLLGHMYAEAAGIFGEIDSEFSEAAKKAISVAKGQMFQSDWLKVFEPENVHASVVELTTET